MRKVCIVRNEILVGILTMYKDSTHEIVSEYHLPAKRWTT